MRGAVTIICPYCGEKAERRATGFGGFKPKTCGGKECVKRHKRCLKYAKSAGVTVEEYRNGKRKGREHLKVPYSHKKSKNEKAMDENMKTADGIRKEVEGAVLFLRRKLCKERGVFWCRECKKELPQSMRSAGNGYSSGRCRPCDNKRRLSGMFGKGWKGTSAYKKWLREYRRDQRKDPQYKVKNENRNRIRRAIIAQTGDATRVPKGKVKYLGCDPAQAAAYLESMFVGHMSWENYGKAWHIDHVVPCASFDLTKEEEIAKCFHYTNLQPMWARTNLRKGARTGHVHQPKLLI